MSSQSHRVVEVLEALDERLPDAYWVAELIASIPVGIAILSAADLRLIAANRPMRTALMDAGGQVAGRRFAELVPAGHALSNAELYRHVAQTGEALELEPFTHRGKRWQCSIRALKSGSGDIRHLLIALAETRESFVEDVNRLREVEQAKKEFLKLASHELRTPLAVIIGYASLLAPGGLSPSNQQLAGLRIYQKARQLNRLIAGLTQVAYFDEIGPGMPREALDLVALVAEAVRESQRRSPDLAFQLNLGAAAARVMGNRDWLMAAFRELLENAMRFRPGPGRVDVDVADLKDRWIVTVADDGFGIDPSDQPRLFQRFARIETDANRHLVGLGIGLYIVREVAAAHQGKIEVQSAPGIGSRFRVELPKSQAR